MNATKRSEYIIDKDQQVIGKGRTVRAVYWIAGLPDCRSAGLLVCRIAGLPDCCITGLPDCRSAGYLVERWDGEGDFRSCVDLGFDADFAAKSLDSFLDDVEAEAGAGRGCAGAVEHVKYLVEMGLGNALALVFNSNGSAVLFYNTGYFNIHTTVAAIPDRIAQ
jgi:hypothetical protein